MGGEVDGNWVKSGWRVSGDWLGAVEGVDGGMGGGVGRVRVGSGWESGWESEWGSEYDVCGEWVGSFQNVGE